MNDTSGRFSAWSKPWPSSSSSSLASTIHFGDQTIIRLCRLLAGSTRPEIRVRFRNERAATQRRMLLLTKPRGLQEHPFDADLDLVESLAR